MRYKICPKCGGTTFLVTAHVTQGWKVGIDGSFQECTNECEEVTHAPDNDDIWQCENCGYDAPGSTFEVDVEWVSRKKHEGGC